MSSHEFMTVAEVAERLRVSERTVRQLIMRGELPAIKIGKEWRIARAELEAFLKKRK